MDLLPYAIKRLRGVCMDKDTDVQEAIEKLIEFFGNATYEEIMEVLEKIEI